jgi:hypothetical protein
MVLQKTGFFETAASEDSGSDSSEGEGLVGDVQFAGSLSQARRLKYLVEIASFAVTVASDNHEPSKPSTAVSSKAATGPPSPLKTPMAVPQSAIPGAVHQLMSLSEEQQDVNGVSSQLPETDSVSAAALDSGDPGGSFFLTASGDVSNDQKETEAWALPNQSVASEMEIVSPNAQNSHTAKLDEEEEKEKIKRRENHVKWIRLIEKHGLEWFNSVPDGAIIISAQAVRCAKSAIQVRYHGWQSLLPMAMPLRICVKDIHIVDMVAMDLVGTSDPYCEVEFVGNKYTTGIIYETLSPVWKDLGYEYTLHDCSNVMSISVWDWDDNSDHDLIGRCFLHAEDIIQRADHALTRVLYNDRGAVQGKLTLRVLCESIPLKDDAKVVARDLPSDDPETCAIQAAALTRIFWHLGIPRATASQILQVVLRAEAPLHVIAKMGDAGVFNVAYSCPHHWMTDIIGRWKLYKDLQDAQRERIQEERPTKLMLGQMNSWDQKLMALNEGAKDQHKVSLNVSKYINLDQKPKGNPDENMRLALSFSERAELHVSDNDRAENIVEEFLDLHHELQNAPAGINTLALDLMAEILANYEREARLYDQVDEEIMRIQNTVKEEQGPEGQGLKPHGDEKTGLAHRWLHHKDAMDREKKYMPMEYYLEPFMKTHCSQMHIMRQAVVDLGAYFIKNRDTKIRKEIGPIVLAIAKIARDKHAEIEAAYELQRKKLGKLGAELEAKKRQTQEENVAMCRKWLMLHDDQVQTDIDDEMTDLLAHFKVNLMWSMSAAVALERERVEARLLELRQSEIDRWQAEIEAARLAEEAAAEQARKLREIAQELETAQEAGDQDEILRLRKELSQLEDLGSLKVRKEGADLEASHARQELTIDRHQTPSQTNTSSQHEKQTVIECSEMQEKKETRSSDTGKKQQGKTRKVDGIQQEKEGKVTGLISEISLEAISAVSDQDDEGKSEIDSDDSETTHRGTKKQPTDAKASSKQGAKISTAKVATRTNTGTRKMKAAKAQPVDCVVDGMHGADTASVKGPTKAASRDDELAKETSATKVLAQLSPSDAADLTSAVGQALVAQAEFQASEEAKESRASVSDVDTINSKEGEDVVVNTQGNTGNDVSMVPIWEPEEKEHGTLSVAAAAEEKEDNSAVVGDEMLHMLELKGGLMKASGVSLPQQIYDAVNNLSPKVKYPVEQWRRSLMTVVTWRERVFLVWKPKPDFLRRQALAKAKKLVLAPAELRKEKMADMSTNVYVQYVESIKQSRADDTRNRAADRHKRRLAMSYAHLLQPSRSTLPFDFLSYCKSEDSLVFQKELNRDAKFVASFPWRQVFAIAELNETRPGMVNEREKDKLLLSLCVQDSKGVTHRLFSAWSDTWELFCRIRNRSRDRTNAMQMSFYFRLGETKKFLDTTVLVNSVVTLPERFEQRTKLQVNSSPVPEVLRDKSSPVPEALKEEKMIPLLLQGSSQQLSKFDIQSILAHHEYESPRSIVDLTGDEPNSPSRQTLEEMQPFIKSAQTDIRSFVIEEVALLQACVRRTLKRNAVQMIRHMVLQVVDIAVHTSHIADAAMQSIVAGEILDDNSLPQGSKGALLAGIQVPLHKLAPTIGINWQEIFGSASELREQQHAINVLVQESLRIQNIVSASQRQLQMRRGWAGDPRFVVKGLTSIQNDRAYMAPPLENITDMSVVNGRHNSIARNLDERFTPGTRMEKSSSTIRNPGRHVLEPLFVDHSPGHLSDKPAVANQIRIMRSRPIVKIRRKKRQETSSSPHDQPIPLEAFLKEAEFTNTIASWPAEDLFSPSIGPAVPPPLSAVKAVEELHARENTGYSSFHGSRHDEESRTPKTGRSHLSHRNNSAHDFAPRQPSVHLESHTPKTGRSLLSHRTNSAHDSAKRQLSVHLDLIASSAGRETEVHQVRNTSSAERQPSVHLPRKTNSAERQSSGHLPRNTSDGSFRQPSARVGTGYSRIVYVTDSDEDVDLVAEPSFSYEAHTGIIRRGERNQESSKSPERVEKREKEENPFAHTLQDSARQAILKRIADLRARISPQRPLLGQQSKLGKRALAHVSAELRANKEFMLRQVQQDPRALRFADDSLKGDFEVVLAAVQQNGRMLEHAAPALQDQEQIVLPAVKQCGRALKFASDRLKDASTVVIEAVQNDVEALFFASERQKDNTAVAHAALASEGLALEHLSPRLKKDHAAVLIAMKNNSRSVAHADVDWDAIWAVWKKEKTLAEAETGAVIDDSDLFDRRRRL